MAAGEGETGRVPLVAGNWKMFKTSDEGVSFIVELGRRLGRVDGREVMVAPAFTGLYEAVKAAEGTCVSVAAQDLFWEKTGPYTGEVSANMLADLGVRATIIGHSERRQSFGETDEATRKKVRAALDEGLLPILCVGETQEDRAAGLTSEVLTRQVTAGLASGQAHEGSRIAIAYEPVWAIGTGMTASPESAQEAIVSIREQVTVALGRGAAEAIRILYGGSVGPDNISGLMAQPDVDGVLVGSASLNLDSFTRIVNFEKQ